MNVNKRTKLTLWIAGAIVSIPALFILGIGLLMCKSSVSSKTYSSTYNFLADVEDIDCGAVSGFNVDVMIRQWPFWLSNPYLGRGAHLLHSGGPPSQITIQWKDDHNLDVKCRGCSEKDSQVFLSQWKGITVHFVFLPSEQK